MHIFEVTELNLFIYNDNQKGPFYMGMQVFILQ